MTVEIIKKLDTANEKLDIMLQWRAGLEERCKSHLEKTEEMRTVLFSNPSGLVSRVDKLNNCKESLFRWQKFWLYVLRIVVAAAIISLAGLLLFIYRERSNQEMDSVKSHTLTTEIK